MVEVPNRPAYRGELFETGLEVRRDVLGRAGDFVAVSRDVGAAAKDFSV